MVVPASIARQEIKYPVAAEQVPAVRRALEFYCEADRHATTGADGLYTIDSLYFDTDDFILFRLAEDNALVRSKVRVRSYVSPAGRSAKVKLEVKFRRGSVTTKTSASLAAKDWARFARDPASAPPMPTAEEQDAFDKFSMEVLRYRVAPRIMVRYQRAAYFSYLDDYVRVTFDRRVQAQAHRDFDFNVMPHQWMDIDGAEMAGEDSTVVMEIKFKQAPPRWLVDIVRRFELNPYGFSKYGNSVRRFQERARLFDAGAQPGGQQRAGLRVSRFN